MLELEELEREGSAVPADEPVDPKHSLPLRLLRLVLMRLGLGVLTMFAMTVLVFVSTRLLPGDTAKMILGRQATPDNLADLRKRLGLDKPAPQQFWDWFSGLLHGDLGTSLVANQPVTTLLHDRVTLSAVLVLIATVISIPFAVAIGSIAGARRDSLFDHVTSFIGIVLAALPEFVLGILMILLFATGLLHVFPPVSQVELGRSIWSQLNVVVLPALVLAGAIAPYVARILRASVIEVAESDYVLMARLKGVRERSIIKRHILPNAIAPTIQVTALCLAWLAGGIVVVEYLFNYPGIGSSLVDAVQSRDLPMLQAIVLIITGFYVVCNLTADLLTILVSPRLRTGML